MPRLIAAGLMALTLTGCASHVPPNLSPAGVITYNANHVVIAIGTLQRAAIELNHVAVCTDATPAVCHPLLSQGNTDAVVDAVTDALKTLRSAPAGWRATALTALDRVDARLDAAGKADLKPYVQAVRTVLSALR